MSPKCLYTFTLNHHVLLTTITSQQTLEIKNKEPICFCYHF